jgi:DNA-binding FadR family transcriptional regulator
MSTLAVLPRERLIDRAIEAIKTHMIASALQAGDRLPSEAELALRSVSVAMSSARRSPPSRPWGSCVQRTATHNPFLASFGLIVYRFFWGLASQAPRVASVPVSRMASSHRALLNGLMSRDQALIPHLVAQHLGSATPEDNLEPRLGSIREVTV